MQGKFEGSGPVSCPTARRQCPHCGLAVRALQDHHMLFVVLRCSVAVGWALCPSGETEDGVFTNFVIWSGPFPDFFMNFEQVTFMTVKLSAEFIKKKHLILVPNRNIFKDSIRVSSPHTITLKCSFFVTKSSGFLEFCR